MRSPKRVSSAGCLRADRDLRTAVSLFRPQPAASPRLHPPPRLAAVEPSAPTLTLGSSRPYRVSAGRGLPQRVQTNIGRQPECPAEKRRTDGVSPGEGSVLRLGQCGLPALSPSTKRAPQSQRPQHSALRASHSPTHQALEEAVCCLEPRTGSPRPKDPIPGKGGGVTRPRPLFFPPSLGSWASPSLLSPRAQLLDALTC